MDGVYTQAALPLTQPEMKEGSWLSEGVTVCSSGSHLSPDASRLEFWNVLCLGYLGMASYLQYVWAAEEGQTPSGFWERGPMKQNATKHE